LCGDDLAKAVGHLVILWGNVSVHADNGFVRDYPDAQLEKWAEWTGTRGEFAAWLREHHLDEDGRIRDWDEYAGALEARRARERARVASMRADPQRRTHGVAQHAHGVRAMLQPARANETRRNETKRDETEESTTSPPTAAATPAYASPRVGRTEGELAFLLALPDAEQPKWERIIDGWLNGVGYASGRAADPLDVHVGLVEYLANPGNGELNARHVVRYVQEAERRRTEPPPERAAPGRRAGNRGPTLLSELIAGARPIPRDDDPPFAREVS
jgi:hypothetical protein